MNTVDVFNGIPQDRKIVSAASEERFKSLVEKFANEYNGIQPKFICRAPGRVNLIGEHIDYCGYSVFPMAIDQDIVSVFIENDNNQVEIANTNKTYQASSFDIKNFIISYEKSAWYEYFKCGIQGIRDKFPNVQLKGMKILIDGTIPCSAGLSSSSALVVCAALTTVLINNIEIGKNELAELCAECEKYIGTQGGGMDQATSCLAQEGSAMLISFNPLKTQKVSLPNGSAFVVTHSLTEINKAATDHFNIRVSECRLATQVIANAKELDWRSIRKPYELQKALRMTIVELEKLANDTLHENAYTFDEIADLLNVTIDELIKVSSLKETINRKQSFELFKRMKHVCSEANRVLEFKNVCHSNVDHCLETLGQLMNESHFSCSNLYECSSKELDELTDICRQSGALGSRLTGAGWGGCAVSLVRQENLNEFISNVRDKFYFNSPDSKRAVKADTSIFPTLPGHGIYAIQL